MSKKMSKKMSEKMSEKEVIEAFKLNFPFINISIEQNPEGFGRKVLLQYDYFRSGEIWNNKLLFMKKDSESWEEWLKKEVPTIPRRMSINFKD